MSTRAEGRRDGFGRPRSFWMGAYMRTPLATVTPMVYATQIDLPI
jgi:hypothetical protein